MDETLVFIDEGFLSKLSKFFGGGKYLKFDRVDFVKKISQMESLHCKEIFLYDAPPFHSDKPSSSEIKRKEGYDKFRSSLIKRDVVFREGKCQRLKQNGEFVYRQKGVDTLVVMDLMRVPYEFNVKKIILIASDSDFVPILKNLEKKGIKTILYTYYEKNRKSKFSTSNELIESVSRYVRFKKEDFILREEGKNE